MSADQELAATGGGTLIGVLSAGLLLIGAGIVMVWRKIAERSASRIAD